MPSSSLRPINPKNNAAYLLSDPPLIRHHLQQLVNRHELVAIYPAYDSPVFALSSLLELTEDELWLDIPADKLLTERLRHAGHGIVVAHSGNIHSQFEFAAIANGLQDGKPALRIPFPAQIMHLQRRDAYRQRIPVRDPVQCQVPVAGHDDVILAVTDISVNGIGLLGFSPELPLRRGMVLTNCKINLPECGLLVAELAVQSVEEHHLRQQIATLRTGCSFVALPPGAQSLIMRYINRIERQRLQQLAT